MTIKDKKNQASGKWLIAAAGVAAVIAAVLATNFHGVIRQPVQAPGAVTKAHIKGQMKNFVLKPSLPATTDFAFRNVSGEELKLSDWKGRIVLLNLWATWCAPCRSEMPSLNRLQNELGSEQFEVVALSVDHKGLSVSAKFLKETGADALKLYVDKRSKSIKALKVVGLPATLLIDRKGREIGRLLGPTEWDTAETKALIMAAVDDK